MLHNNHEVKKSDYGILLIHGLGGNKKELLNPELWLSHDGYKTINCGLPDLTANKEEYYEYVKEYYLQLSKECKGVFLIGHCFGGSLALKLAEEFPTMGIILVNGMIQLSFFHKIVLNFCQLIYRITKINFEVGKKPLYPITSLFILQENIEEIKSDLVKVNIPILYIRGKQDNVVPKNNVKIIFQHVSSDVKEELILDCDHMVFDSQERFRAIDSVKNFIYKIIYSKEVKNK